MFYRVLKSFMDKIVALTLLGVVAPFFLFLMITLK